MSAPRHGREHQSPTRLDTNRYRTRKVGRVELDHGVPESDTYTNPDINRVNDVATSLKSVRDVNPSKSPVIDHRPSNQRVRLKRNVSGASLESRQGPQSPERLKPNDFVSKRGVDNVDYKIGPKAPRRSLPSTPSKTIHYNGREDKRPISKSMPVNKLEFAHDNYAQNNQRRIEPDRIKQKPESQRKHPNFDYKDHEESFGPRSSREEVIPLKEIRPDKPSGVTSPRVPRKTSEPHKRSEGGATVTFQMQEEDSKNKQHQVHSNPKQVTSPKRGSHFPERAQEKSIGDNYANKGKYGCANVPNVHKHYLSPDGHPSMVEKSKSQHRLQNQSSTETSGLGETITSGFSSQESLASHCSGGRPSHTATVPFYDQGIDLSEDTTTDAQERYHTFETKAIDSDRVIHSSSVKRRTGTKSSSPTKIKTLYVDDSPTKISKPETPHSRKRKVSDKTIRDKPMIEGLKSREVFLGPTDNYSNSLPKTSVTSPNVATTTKPKTLDLAGYHAGPNFDELFMQSESLPVPQTTTMGLQVEQINTEWNKHNRASSIKSRSSHGSFRSRSGSTRRSKRFLTDADSRWMKWGRDRRASFRRRLEKMEKPEPELQPRASTPVKKARQEGLMFIHPDLESKYISEEDINYIQRHRQERLKTYKVIEKAKKVPYELQHHELNRLTVAELNILTRFWEHRVFVRSRYVSILLSLGTIIIYVLSICSGQWISYPAPNNMNRIAHEGLWFKCRPVLEAGSNEETCDETAHRVGEAFSMVTKMKNFLKFKTGENQHDMRKFGEEYYLREARLWRPFRWAGLSATLMALVLTLTSVLNENWLRGQMIEKDKSVHDMRSSLWNYKCSQTVSNSSETQCLESYPHWQNAVIGLMLFSAGFGFVAAVLAICGVCTSPLPKKIYYFHSAGEIFFVCALSTTVALIIYPVAIAMDDTIQSHTYGSGYGLGWGGTAFFFAASLCMSLDELVRESQQNKCCRYLCWRSRRNDRGEHPV